VEIHARYGGVVPEVASRQHMLAIIPVIQKATEDAGTDWNDIGESQRP
jgi:N6-L-threonylcarbamoyladenine synthase